jgi:HEPN domain-containing protein
MDIASTNWPSWVEKADSDLLSIRNNLAAAEVPWDVVCFHAQQAAERMLKAFLVQHGVQPRRTHDLLSLLGECVAFDQTLGVISQQCTDLNVFAVDIRYPEPAPSPDETLARAAVQAAEHVCGAVRERLPS